MPSPSLARRHQPRSSGSAVGVVIGLILGGAAVAAILLARPGGREAAPQAPLSANPPPAVEHPTVDPFAAVELDSTIGASGALEASVTADLDLWRGYSDTSDWKLAIQAAGQGYPLLERYRTVRAETDRFAEVLPWEADARAAHRQFAEAVARGGAVESALREARANDYRFNRIRSLVSEWAALERELADAIAVVEAR